MQVFTEDPWSIADDGREQRKEKYQYSSNNGIERTLLKREEVYCSTETGWCSSETPNKQYLRANTVLYTF